MTTRPTLGRGNASDPPGDARLDGGGTRLDGIPDTHGSQDGPHRDHLVSRPTSALRPHPVYQELCGPIAATRVRRVAQKAGPIREPLLTTTDGTILDGHARWQVATERQQPSLPCIEYDVTEEEALQVVIQRHRTSEGLNDYCRIVLALGLEPYFRERSHRRPQPTTGNKKPSSNLTNNKHRDVRKDIAGEAGVSTGNVTKVKQILDSVIPEVRERLLRGEVSIHRAWQWRTLVPKGQRDALWQHLYHGAINRTIGRLTRAHAESGRPVGPTDVASTVLSGLPTCNSTDITVAVVDVPGRAVVVTRACYDELLEKRTDGPR